MKIDTYRSSKTKTYELVVPAGTDVTTLQGDAGVAATKLSPLIPHKKGANLSDEFKGGLLEHLQKQIPAEGAGLVKSEVHFDEVSE